MSKTEKLLEKLRNETISANELRTLLARLDWILDHRRGSHEYWYKNGERITLASHIKEFPRYQIRQVKQKLGV